ncbi:MAG: diadenylate cyclase CdaA [Syntrophomonadaceae bacterium]|nr:diadenylate cyclase CdaA [Syntrophomonadaceae bacterium]
MDLSFLSGVFASPWDIIKSLVDIAIVAFIFYKIMSLFRNTRAEQLLRGLLILVVFSVVVSVLRLEMLSWLLEKLWILFIITIPIVFQPELRRVLEQLGRGQFFNLSFSGSSSSAQMPLIISEVVTAASNLSRSRTGALMVFVRQTGINEHLESGTAVDALVSSSLLMNIFVPNSPLHDGAAVIRGDRLYKAACVLPLSGNLNLPPELGTRHRAALGISELSDALVVVVSEETGIISVAEAGKLHRFKDARGLEEFLRQNLLEDEGSRPLEGFLRRWRSDAKKDEG